MSLDLANRIRNVTAVLGPTNTGKTHLAIERMLGHETGLIGLPLRLLAREVYDKIVQRIGADKVALITGEEKIKPESPRYYVCTVEAMPREADVDFLAIDEVQLCADPERGHVFTDRLLHVRGRQETLLLGAQTMREAISDLIPGANFITRPRLSKLTYAGEKKITRLPPRSAVVAFSASEVYAIAELIRRQRGGAAVVLGALSPRTRNAQVALYQSGDVDFLVATDAIGMGLNLDVDHVAFAGTRKFDGQVHRALTPSELAQIGGRAGRHMNDGTFGVTGGVEPLSADVIERLETHTFDTVKSLQWRSRDLDFQSLERLKDSLRETPREMRLTRARMADDTTALEAVSRDPEVAQLAIAPAAVARLWDVCQVPDYRKISTQNHAELVATLYKFIMTGEERIPVDWFAKQVAFADRTDGDIDTLSNRIAHIRTWTFVSNRAEWLADPEHWQGRTKAIEDALSDALHERLTQRFVDRRTSALMRGMKDKDELYAQIGDDGRVEVEKHYVGRLKGFRFFPDTETTAEGIHGKAARNAAAHVLGKELGMRVRRVVSAKNDAFKLTFRGQVMWRDDEIARLEAGDDPLKPVIVIQSDEHLTGPDKEKVQERLNTWITELVGERLKPLVEIAAAKDILGLARGIAFRLVENFGVLRREAVTEEVRSLDQPARAQLRKYGVRFGAFNIYFPTILKPASTELALALWILKNGPAHNLDGATAPEPPRAGLTSLTAAPGVPDDFYRVCGFHRCGPRAVRIDMLERLADLIRVLVSWRADPANPVVPPKGATGDGGFKVTPDMMSILGCSGEELGHVLKALGFWVDRRPLPPEAPAEAAVAKPAEVAAPADADASAVEAATDAAPQQSAEAIAPVEVAVVEQAAVAVEPAPAEVAEAPAAAAAEAVPAAAEPVEVKWEEIWRPRRRGRSFEGPQRDKRPAAEGAEGASGNRGYRARPDRRRQRAEVPPVRTDGQQGEQPPRPAADAKPSHGGEHRRPDRREQRRDGGKFQGGKHGGGFQGGKYGGGGKPRREDRQRVPLQASPPGRKGGFDPDSPFAALSQLKAALDKRTQE